jgi:hypothetical protein
MRRRHGGSTVSRLAPAPFFGVSVCVVGVWWCEAACARRLSFFLAATTIGFCPLSTLWCDFPRSLQERGLE